MSKIALKWLNMNVSELARQLHISTHELREVFSVIGLHIGYRAIKVDAKVAKKVIANWPEYQKLWEEHKRKLAEEEEQEKQEQKNIKRDPVAIPSVITVKSFAEIINIPLTRVMGELMKNGVLASLNERIDFDTASIIAAEFGVETFADKRDSHREEEITTQKKLQTLLQEDDEKKLTARPPVVVVMGHVDHGKTKLLDAIRKTNVVAGESGGITQHIGAYQIERNDRRITFIDTPGHEAFTSMRSRGARIADIAILVVAADDGIKPQTEEAIRIIRQAHIPSVVAVNKMDKPEANLEKVKTELAQFDLLPEDWGGKIPVVPISALKGEGIDKLLEMVLLVADVEDKHIRANPNKNAVATVVEAHIDKSEGPVATLLVQTGTLHKGDYLNTEHMTLGRARVLRSDQGVSIADAIPSTPVQVLGFKQPATIGDIIEATPKPLTKISKARVRGAENAKAFTANTSNDQEEQNKEKHIIPIVLKADVLGSLEAIIAQVEKMEHPEVGIKIIAKGLGNITENDLQQAQAAGGRIIGFHVLATPEISMRAKDNGIPIEYYKVIYELTKKLKEALEDLLPPLVEHKMLGKARVLALFYEKGKQQVIGCRVEEGVLRSRGKIYIMRDGVSVGELRIIRLQTGKQSTEEVGQGSECGLALEGKVRVQEDDILEAFTEEIKKRALEFIS